MIAHLKPYPAMKDSGVLWLGEVPEHWEVQRLGCSVEACINGVWGSEPNGQDDLPCVRVADFDRTRLRVRLVNPTLRAVSLSERNRRLLKAGDLLLEKSGGGDVQPVGVVMLYDHATTAVCSNFVARMPVATEFDSRYLTYLHSHLYAIRLNVRSIKQTTGIQNLDSSSYLSETVAFPPLLEQAFIVRFLDHADRRIRRYIRAKQKLIKLLAEQKQAIIHRAVTRGLDPNVRLKPSGVEWLGEVPEHWEVIRLGRVIDLVTGFPFKSEGFTQAAKDIRLLRGVNVSPGRIRWTDVVRWPQSERESYSAFELQSGDIVLGMDRPIIQSGTRVATVAESDVPAFLLQRVARIRPTDGLSYDFLTLLLAGKAFADYLTPIFTGVSVPHLSPEQIKSFRCALPVDNEQREIVRWVAKNTMKTNAAVLSAEREISLLREYRTRLIADLVTGKLDVREAAAQLPDEDEEPEPFDEAESEDDAEETGAEDADNVSEGDEP